MALNHVGGQAGGQHASHEPQRDQSSGGICAADAARAGGWRRTFTASLKLGDREPVLDKNPGLESHKQGTIPN